MTCPHCGSSRLRVETADWGVDRETGYHDTDEVVTCLNCWRVMEAGDLVEEKELVKC